MSAQVLEGNGSVVSESDLQQLELHLQSRLSGRVRDLRLVIRDGGLILHGHAHTYHAKQLARHAVMEAINLPILVNDIEVSPGSVESEQRRAGRGTGAQQLVSD